MKIATFNINNINKRLENLLAWLVRAEPDVVCLQELKAEQNAFPAQALRAAGYEAVWQGERSWNGVAILTRGHAAVLTRADPAAIWMPVLVLGGAVYGLALTWAGVRGAANLAEQKLPELSQIAIQSKL